MTKYSGSEAILQLCAISSASDGRTSGADHSSHHVAERSREQQMQPAQSARMVRMETSAQDPSPPLHHSRDEIVPLNHDQDDQDDDMSGGLEKFLTNPQNDGNSSRRITDDDVQRYIAQRKQFDDRQKQTKQH